MSLQIWLPLNGNLNNQGLSNIIATNNGATIDDNGKIGKCYSFDGTDDYVSIDCSDLYTTFSGGPQNFSIAFWVYHSDATRGIIFGDYGLSGGINFNIELTTSHGIRFYWAGSPDKNFNSTSYVTASGWTHICITYNGTQVQIYKDGILSSDKYSGTLATKNKTSGLFYLGRDNRTGTTALNGKLNDFRIYNHCLSQKEIEEIAKGLVLHYKLDSISNVNLISSLKSYNSGAYLAYQWNLSENLVANETYTLQLWNVNVYHSAKTAEQTGVWVYWGGGSVNLFNWKGSTYFTQTDTTNYHADYLVKTFTITSSQASGSGATNSWLNIYNSVGNADGTRSMSIGSWKLEKSSVATPIDSNNIIQDCSGYGNNGTLVGTATASSDTARYNACTYFDASSAINCGRGGMVTDSITINLWAKYTTFSNLVSCTESGGWNLENNSGLTFPVYIDGGVGYVHIATASRPAVASFANNWHMFTGVYDRIGQLVKLYIDGELQGTGTVSSPNPIKYHATNVIWLNAEATGSNTTGTYGNSKQMSDFRIYCTALTDAQIKELYSTSATIDNNGNIYARELVEI